MGKSRRILELELEIERLKNERAAMQRQPPNISVRSSTTVVNRQDSSDDLLGTVAKVGVGFALGGLLFDD